MKNFKGTAVFGRFFCAYLTLERIIFIVDGLAAEFVAARIFFFIRISEFNVINDHISGVMFNAVFLVSGSLQATFAEDFRTFATVAA